MNKSDKADVRALFAKNLRELRKERGLSQKALAEKSGVDEMAIVGYEKGTRTPGIDKLVSLARALCVSTTDLLGVDSSPLTCQRTANQITQHYIELAQSAGLKAYATPATGRIILETPRKLFCDGDGNVTGSEPLDLKFASADLFTAFFDRLIADTLKNTDLQDLAEQILGSDSNVD